MEMESANHNLANLIALVQPVNFGNSIATLNRNVVTMCFTKHILMRFGLSH